MRKVAVHLGLSINYRAEPQRLAIPHHRRPRAEIFGLSVKPGDGYFAQVQVNEHLTLDFADKAEPWGGPGFDRRTGNSHHYAFHVNEEELEGIFSRVKAKGIPYGS